jgi:hypothetical protein
VSHVDDQTADTFDSGAWPCGSSDSGHRENVSDYSLSSRLVARDSASRCGSPLRRHSIPTVVRLGVEDGIRNYLSTAA